jgi:transposase-like protein
MTENLTGKEFEYDTHDKPNGCYEFCPVCHSENLELDGTENDTNGTLYRVYRCNDCGSVFDLTYQIVGAYVHRDGRFKED